MEKAKLDNLHYSFQEIDGYNKDINIVISARELGKTCAFWTQKAYSCWKRKESIVYVVRYHNEISEELINSIFENNINKFFDDETPIYKKEFKEGICDIYLEHDKEKFRAIRIISLNCKLRKLKQTTIPNLKYMFFDEYIINPESGETYLKDEALKLKELFTTLKRGAINNRLKIYAVGNCYSLYNPLFIDLNVDVNKLKLGSKIIGDNYIIDYAILNPLLKEKLLKENPFYQFETDYIQYALEGQAINDSNIPLGERPINYSLRYVFKVGRIFLGIYKNNSDKINEFNFYVQEEKQISKNRDIYIIDLKDMQTNGILISYDERYYLNRFKDAISKRNVLFNNINCYYIIKDIFIKL